MGRPSLLTPEVIHKLVEAVSVGATWQRACDYALISYSALRKWVLIGEREDAPMLYVELVQRLKEAEGHASLAALATIRKAAAEGEWTAAAWLLERRYPNEYGRRVLLPLGPNSDEALTLASLDALLSDPEDEADRALDAHAVIETKALPAPAPPNGNGHNGHGTNGHTNGHDPP